MPITIGNFFFFGFLGTISIILPDAALAEECAPKHDFKTHRSFLIGSVQETSVREYLRFFENPRPFFSCIYNQSPVFLQPLFNPFFTLFPTILAQRQRISEFSFLRGFLYRSQSILVIFRFVAKNGFFIFWVRMLRFQSQSVIFFLDF